MTLAVEEKTTSDATMLAIRQGIDHDLKSIVFNCSMMASRHSIQTPLVDSHYKVDWSLTVDISVIQYGMRVIIYIH